MLTDRPAPPARDRRGRTNATLGDTATRPGEPNRLHAGRRVARANETDMAGLSLLAGERAYEALEKDFQRLIQLNDSPLWSIGTYRGVVSKIDLLYAIARYVTRDDLKRYFDVARMVLGEDDPSLDLAEDQRWAASIHGKTREFSPACRQGISETLVLLAVRGPFQGTLGDRYGGRGGPVVRDLLSDPSPRAPLEANDRDLPLYAEAAPTEFLSIIERDLKTSSPAVSASFVPLGPAYSAVPAALDCSGRWKGSHGIRRRLVQ